MMSEPPKPPSFPDISQPPTPVYLRKLARKTDWGSDDNPPQARAENVVRLVIHRDSHPFSVYLVRTDEELRRVIIGMNGGRESLSSESYFIAFHPEDLATIGLRAQHTPEEGLTACRFAGTYHHDIVGSEPAITTLCIPLFRTGRKVDVPDRRLMWKVAVFAHAAREAVKP